MYFVGVLAQGYEAGKNNFGKSKKSQVISCHILNVKMVYISKIHLRILVSRTFIIYFTAGLSCCKL